jgi:hypothetical protein
MSEAINTNKADPVTAFRKAINAAITAADRGVSTSEMVGYLRSRATALEDQNYRGQYVPPRMYDQNGKLIDYVKQAEEAQAARAERQRIADEIPAHLRQHAASGYRAP